jgi:hypothetical protein
MKNKPVREPYDKLSISLPAEMSRWISEQIAYDMKRRSPFIQDIIRSYMRSQKKDQISYIPDLLDGTKPIAAEERASYGEAKRPVLSKHQARKSQK